MQSIGNAKGRGKPMATPPTTAAKQATAGRFSPASAPKLVVNNR